MDLLLILFISMSLTEIVKRINLISTSFSPIVNILITTVIIFSYCNFSASYNLLLGVTIGIFGTGLYSSVKNVLIGIQARQKPTNAELRNDFQSL